MPANILSFKGSIIAKTRIKIATAAQKYVSVDDIPKKEGREDNIINPYFKWSTTTQLPTRMIYFLLVP